MHVRVVSLVAGLAFTTAGVVRAQEPPASEPPAAPVLGVSGPELYPAAVLGQFMLGDLTWDGCAPVYLKVKGTFGCPMFRDEPVAFDLRIAWSGPGLLRLFPAGTTWVDVRLRDREGEDVALPVAVRVLADGEAGLSADGGIELNEGTQARLRVNLSPAAAMLTPGPHTVCFDVTAFSDSALQLVQPANRCVPFTVYETRSRAARAERLRRAAIDLLAEFRCDEAVPVIDALLRVHPRSAVAFRLRGIIAELRRDNAAAAANYAEASALMRPDGDTLLIRGGTDYRASAERLDEWRASVEMLATFAPELSLLGPAEEGLTCRPRPQP